MKRKRSSPRGLGPSKHPKHNQHSTISSQDVTHPVLRNYYPRLVTLRQWLLMKLGEASKRRRKALEDLDCGILGGSSQDALPDAIAARILDETLVGFHTISRAETRDHHGPLHHFSQHVGLSGNSSASTRSSGVGAQMSEVVDFCIWRLFHSIHSDSSKPPHILCHGMHRGSSTWKTGTGDGATHIPGLSYAHPNQHADTLRGAAWARILRLLGDGGDRVMIDLLLDCGLFSPMNKDQGTYYQLSGMALTEVPPLAKLDSGPRGRISKARGAARPALRRPSEIRVVRNRILYARAALNAKGEVAFGLRHIHAFNRYRNTRDTSHATHLLNYIFPRQFGLHNVFTSATNPRETVQPFHDYTLREKEISAATPDRFCKVQGKVRPTSLPKRLRGEAVELSRKLQRLHSRCSYTQLLSLYCPSAATKRTEIMRSNPVPTGSQSKRHDDPSGEFEASNESSLTDLATPIPQVSAFCQAVIRHVFPQALLGQGKAGNHNWAVLQSNVDLFIKSRRFESISLEALMRDIKIGCIAWLRPPHVSPNDPMSMSDFKKRQELLFELLYYIFDSFLVPLVRTNFHVTESSMHRNRLFYFRHDMWRRLTEPALTELKTSMLEEIGDYHAFRKMDKQTLGFSQIRLLPKSKGMRPITNLRRRMQVTQNGRQFMAKSINSLLAPAYSVLDLEKIQGGDRLGSSMFSVGELYPKLQAFRTKFSANTNRRLFFVKVDVKSCFDSLPQEAVLNLAQSLISSEGYTVSRYAHMKQAEFAAAGEKTGKPVKSFKSNARRGDMRGTFTQQTKSAEQMLRPNGVFVDAVVPHKVTRKQATEILRHHIRANVIKIGKKYYRQKRGIPQGSVVSSLLCSLFFADMEHRHLDFIDSTRSMLTRLIDDFLLVTTDRQQALQFLETMHAGIPEYGIAVKPTKSLVNFDVSIDGGQVPRLGRGGQFPYCGLLIDTCSLDISRDRTVNNMVMVGDSLTVEYNKLPGSSFQRKMLSALKMQLHTMLLDTSYNSLITVWRNVYNSMVEVAKKMVAYYKSLEARQRPSIALMIRSAQSLIDLAEAMIRSKRNKLRSANYRCAISRHAVEHITARAFLAVVGRRQSVFRELVTHLKRARMYSETRLSVKEQRCRLSLVRKSKPQSAA